MRKIEERIQMYAEDEVEVKTIIDIKYSHALYKGNSQRIKV